MEPGSLKLKNDQHTDHRIGRNSSPNSWDPKSGTPNPGLQYFYGVDYGTLRWICFSDPSRAPRSRFCNPVGKPRVQHSAKKQTQENTQEKKTDTKEERPKQEQSKTNKIRNTQQTCRRSCLESLPPQLDPLAAWCQSRWQLPRLRAGSKNKIHKAL